MNLTKEQQEIIYSNEKKIMVKAGAGTGKSEVLISRIIRLLDDNSNLSITDIAVITFTNKATEELHSRLKKRMYEKYVTSTNKDIRMRYRYELEILNNAQISTIHGFCQSILNYGGPMYGDKINYSPDYPVKISSQIQLAVANAIELFLKERKSNEFKHLSIMPIHRLRKIIADTYEMLRNKGLNVKEILSNTYNEANLEIEPEIKLLRKELVTLIELTDQQYRLVKHECLDADDLLEFCLLRLKSDPFFLKKVQDKFKYIFIDEFQDTSFFQSEIVKTICNDSSNAPYLFVVGDIKQSIYQFRGANLNAFSEIENWISSNGKIYTLTTNWRSNPTLVLFINTIFDKISKNKNYIFYHTPLVPKHDNNFIDLNKIHEWLYFDNKNMPESMVANWLKQKLANDDPNNYCILFRNNYEIKPFETELQKHDIPYKVIGSGDFYNRKEITEVLKVLNFLYYPNQDKYAYEALDTSLISNADYKIQSLSKIRPQITKLTPAQILDAIYKKLEVKKIYDNQQYANLIKLKNIARNLSENITLGQFIDWLSLMIRTKKDETQADYLEQGKFVKLMTIHMAKGLEFPVVILPNLNQKFSDKALNPEILLHLEKKTLEFCYSKYFDNDAKIISSSYIEANEQNKKLVIEEELRVLYVALTRAKEKLVFVGKKIPPDIECYQKWLK